MGGFYRDSLLKAKSLHLIENSVQLIVTLLNFENRCWTNQPQENLMKQTKTLKNTNINPVEYLSTVGVFENTSIKSDIFHKQVS